MNARHPWSERIVRSDGAENNPVNPVAEENAKAVPVAPGRPITGRVGARAAAKWGFRSNPVANPEGGTDPAACQRGRRAEIRLSPPGDWLWVMDNSLYSPARRRHRFHRFDPLRHTPGGHEDHRCVSR